MTPSFKAWLRSRRGLHPLFPISFPPPASPLDLNLHPPCMYLPFYLFWSRASFIHGLFSLKSFFGPPQLLAFSHRSPFLCPRVSVGHPLSQLPWGTFSSTPLILRVILVPRFKALPLPPNNLLIRPRVYEANGPHFFVEPPYLLFDLPPTPISFCPASFLCTDPL